MRLYLKTSPNLNSIPFNYQQKLVGTVHKWIGCYLSLFFFLVAWRYGEQWETGVP